MSHRVNRRVRACVLAVLAAVGSAWPATANAQTTVLLDAPNTESFDTTIQSGLSATSNYGFQVLSTRADSADYIRRILFKFDTETTIPAKTVIQSAKLTLTVKGGGSETRTLSAHRILNSFDQDAATWTVRKRGYNWATAGGDLGVKYASATVTPTAGSKITFDITALVQQMVNAPTGDSRWTRLVILDAGASSSLSYREFHNSESTTVSARPVLTVVYGATTTAPPPAPEPEPEPVPAPAPAPAPAPQPASAGTLRLLHWNTHHGGRRTDGVNDMDLLVNWIASFNADVISLNEIDDRTMATTLASKLKTKTGINWNWHYDDRGNQLLAKTSLAGSSNCLVNPTYDRKAAHIGVVVNGRPINIWSAHLGLESSAVRTSEVKALKTCSLAWAQARILAGDYNMQADTVEYNTIAVDHYDAWRAAPSKLNYSGNCDGCTRNSRIDYVFSSKGATWLVLKQVQIPDTRNSSGVMPSDHKPMIVTYEVK